MNKTEIIDQIATLTTVPKTKIKFIVDEFIYFIVDSIKTSGDVNIPGLMHLTVKDRPARSGRNPKTGAPLQIAASKTVHASFAKAIKDAVNSKV